jgi:hypothetical protein
MGQQALRIIILILTMFAASSAASANPLEPANCEAAKNNSIPIQVTYHSKDGARTIVQSHPDPSGGRVIWKQELLSDSQHPGLLVTMARFRDGLPVSAELWTTYTGNSSHRMATYVANGLPKDFDRRASITYEMRSSTTDRDNSTAFHVSTISYKFISEDDIKIGAFGFRAVHGETEATDNLGRRRQTFELYIPALLISAVASDAEPILDGFSTAFVEIEPPIGSSSAR